jgi:hypothetical protein
MDGTAAVARRIGLLPKRSRQVAIDSTGYDAGHVSTYFARRTGVERRHFSKLTVVCDTRCHFYLGEVADRGPCSDDLEFREAMLDAFRRHPFEEALADAGYDAEGHHVLVRESLRARSIIPATRGRPSKRLPTGRYRRRMAQRFPKKRYGQRWQIESCFSQDKRRFGSSIEGRTTASRCRALRLRVIVHNIGILHVPPGSQTAGHAA